MYQFTKQVQFLKYDKSAASKYKTDVIFGFLSSFSVVLYVFLLQSVKFYTLTEHSNIHHDTV